MFLFFFIWKSSDNKYICDESIQFGEQLWIVGHKDIKHFKIKIR